MVRRLTPLFLAALLCPWFTTSARAQDPTTANTPAHISVIDGSAALERDGRTDTAPANMPLLAGDRIRTENGRVEILFDDGSTLHLDTNTVVDFESDEVVRLLDGRVRLNIVGPARDVSYRIDAPGAWAQITQAGEYRVSLVRGDTGPEVELAVVRGAAELVNEDGRTPLGAGQRAFAHANAAPSYAYVFNSAAWDAFDRWSEMRRDQRLAMSTQYLPNEVRPYASTFDQYGSWQYQPTYGYVWYPSVSVGWRPYYYGRWATLRPYGWTWIGTDPWAWPTHHYGRWGFSSGVWFWIPGRHWAPAWVSWAYAPGYVSWCPLGWDNRPVVSFLGVNVYRGYRGYDPWRAWTVVPQRRFGTGFVNVNVRADGFGGRRVDPRSFRVADRAPAMTGYAVPRSDRPIRVAGTGVGTAMPRGSGYAAPRSASPGAYNVSPQPSRPGDARENFRNRGMSGGGLSGPGFPAPSRAPREPSATVRSGVAVPRDRAVPQTQPAPAAHGDRAVAPRAAAPSYETPGRRAVPRTYEGSGIRPEGRAVPRGGNAPSYSSPEYRRVPMTPRRSDEGAVRANPPVEYGRPGMRAIPRSGPSETAPPPMYRRAPEGDRTMPAAPPRGYEPRGYERAPSGPPPSAPPASAPPPSYRSAPGGGERQAPSGAPPSAAPHGGSRPSGGHGGDRARPRGGN